MDTRGPEHDVHPSDCTQFTGKNVFHFTLLVSGSVCTNCVVLLSMSVREPNSVICFSLIVSVLLI